MLRTDNFKILKTIRGFSVWKLKDYGSGYAWDMVQRFPTHRQAVSFIQKSSKRKGGADYGKDNG